MQNLLLVVHLLTCVALIITILLQRSEGGALGIGGGGGLMAGRSAADGLARATMVLAAIFFTTSLVLTTLNAIATDAPSEVERAIIESEIVIPDSDAPARPDTPDR